MSKLNSFNNDQTLKNKLVELIKLDKENERIIKGNYWLEEEQRGCNIGCGEHAVCTILNEEFTDRQHEYLSEKLDISESIFHLGDTIFENLPDDKSNQFVVDFWGALQVGYDYTHFDSKIKIQILTNEEFGCIKHANEETKTIINQIVDLHKRKILGEGVESEMSAAESAAWSAAESAAWSARSAWSAESAAWSAESAESAAWSAAESAESAAESAESAAWSAAWSARSAWSAESAFFEKLAVKFLEMLKED